MATVGFKGLRYVVSSSLGKTFQNEVGLGPIKLPVTFKTAIFRYLA